MELARDGLRARERLLIIVWRREQVREKSEKIGQRRGMIYLVASVPIK
jgi:hypothetical protein